MRDSTERAAWKGEKTGRFPVFYENQREVVENFVEFLWIYA